MFSRTPAIKRLIIKSLLLLCITGCATTATTNEPQKTTISICDASGCSDRPRNSSSAEYQQATSVEAPNAQIMALEEAAKLNTSAAYDLALRFFRGDGVRQDSYRSVKWMRDAAERGDFNAQKALGRLYLTGLEEMGADYGEAEKWLSITSSRGDQEASGLLQQATEAHKSEQAEYKWYNRWRPIFYNNWFRGYSYLQYQGQNYNMAANVSGYGYGAKPSYINPSYYNRSLPPSRSTHKNKPIDDKNSATVASTLPPVIAQQTPVPSKEQQKPIEMTKPPLTQVAAPVVANTTNMNTSNKLERRVALVIGNGDYQFTGPLPNPANDAEDIAQALEKLNFKVILKTDANLETMADAVYQFGENLKAGGVGLFYYSGHGLQVKGENYLLPIDTNLMREDDIKRKAINANDVMEKMGEGKSHLNLVFIDACRNNPFPSSTRAVSRGLIGMNAPNGTLVVFSTNPGNVAADGSGRNGTYTKYLLEQMNQPKLEIGMMLRKVRTAVKEATGGQQVPWENGSIEGEFYFNGN